MKQLTPEQRNQLHFKKSTLESDLNASQQKEMSKIITEQSTKREAGINEKKANKIPLKSPLQTKFLQERAKY
jgi:hypothetical protein